MDSRAVLAHSLSVRRGTIAEVLVVMCITLAILNSLVTTEVPRRVLVLVGVVLLGYEMVGFGSMKYEQYFLYATGLWIVLGLTLNGIFFGEWVQESLYLPGNVAIALALCRRHLHWETATVFFYLVAAYFGYRLATVGSTVDLYHLLTTGSANAVSVLMLVLCGLQYALRRFEGVPLPILPAIVGLVVSALTLGRSGMIASAVLFVGIVMGDLAGERSERRLAGKLVLYSVAAVALVILILPRLDLLSRIFERFLEFGYASTGRRQIWDEYVRQTTGVGLFLGHGRHAVFAGYTNVHNSFLLWHKSLGIMVLPLYLATTLGLGWALVKDWTIFVIFMALLIRSFFDEAILPFRLLDFFFFYLLCTILVTLGRSRRRAPAPPPP